MPKQKKQNRDGVYKRNGAFWISWTDAQGCRRRKKTDAPNITQAKMRRSAETLRAEQAKTLGFTPPGQDTFADLASRYLCHQRSRLTERAYQREEGIVTGHLKPAFGGRVSGVRRIDVQRFVTERRQKVSGGTVAKELNVLKHMLKLAVEWEIIPTNPAQGVKTPKAPAGRVRYLQPTELSALIEASPAWLRPIIALAVNTGMRRSEILGLRWVDVDLAKGRVLLPQTKNGEGRAVYLNRSAIAVLQVLGPRLFADYNPEQVSVAFRRLCLKVGVQDFHFHDLRHTAASWLRMAGADIHTVAQLLGHKDLRMAARYQHLSPAFLAEAVGRLDAVFGEDRHYSVTEPLALQEGGAVTH